MYICTLHGIAYAYVQSDNTKLSVLITYFHFGFGFTDGVTNNIGNALDKIQSILFRVIQMAIDQFWFCWWLGTEQAGNYYLSLPSYTYQASRCQGIKTHYNDVIMGAIASQITSLTSVYSAVYSDADHRKHQSSASLAFVRRVDRWPVNSPHKWPVTRKMLPFDDVIMYWESLLLQIALSRLSMCFILVA